MLSKWFYSFVKLSSGHNQVTVQGDCEGNISPSAQMLEEVFSRYSWTRIIPRGRITHLYHQMRAEEITGQLKCVTNSYKILLMTVDKVTFSPILKQTQKWNMKPKTLWSHEKSALHPNMLGSSKAHCLLVRKLGDMIVIMYLSKNLAAQDHRVL